MSRGLHTPLILRFPDVLGDRVGRLAGAFGIAISRAAYPAPYRGVFPVKCNHDADAIAAVLEFGAAHGFGLEVGSKAELALAAAALGAAGAPPGALLVCNGYKDAEYVEMAMRVAQLGPAVVVVMEQPHEVALAMAAAAAVPGSPALLGIRAKLGTVHGGHWASTSGDAAKFGLSARAIVAATAALDAAGLLPRLALLHFHVGSQMSSLGEVRDALAEGAALYAELAAAGAGGLRFLDVGGGLAIDYDGSGTEEHTSRAYSLRDYADAVVGAVGQACAARRVAPPTLISESGRALASHHAVIVFDVMPSGEGGAEDAGAAVAHSRSGSADAAEGTAAAPSPSGALYSPLQRFSLGEASAGGKGAFLLGTLRRAREGLSADPAALRAALRDAAYFKDDALRAFKAGVLSLGDRAAVEEAADGLAVAVHRLAAAAGVPLGDADAGLPSRMLHVNLSVFRSAVDAWAIGQVFPIVPLAGLDRRPDAAATLADLTCDSDGKIDAFINPAGGPPLRALPVHAGAGAAGAAPYRLAMFLTGVYQETMGSSHNMFGSLNAATVRLRDGGAAPAGAALPCVPSCMSLCSEVGAGAASSDCSSDFALDEPTAGTATANVTVTAAVAPTPAFVVEREARGESVAAVLSRAGHESDALMRSLGAMAAAAVAGGGASPADANAALRCLGQRMDGYTYMR